MLRGPTAGWPGRDAGIAGLKSVLGTTEEKNKMRLKLLAVMFGTALAAGTAYAGPLPGGADTDGDTVENAFDNCVAVANASQTDTNHDACGDSCSNSCDFNGNGITDNPDFNVLRMNFLGPNVPAGTDGDCNGDTLVNNTDFNLLRMQFLGPKNGPSGVTTAQCDTVSCNCTPAP
jgi:hypothetical protein